MKAAILLAGEGTRLRPVTHYVPKPMIPFVGKPFLAYTLENLAGCVDEVVLIVHYKEEVIRGYFGDRVGGVQIRYVRQERLRGTGDALLSARTILEQEDRFLVILGDVYVSQEMIQRMIQDPHRNVLSLAQVDDPEHHLGVDYRDGEAFGLFTENTWADRGVWMFSPAILDYAEKYNGHGSEIRMMRVVERMLEDCVPVGVHLAEEPWVQIGDHSGVQGVLEALEFFLAKAGRDTYCVANRGSLVRCSSVDVEVRDCCIEHSVVFGTDELVDTEIRSSLVYVNGGAVPLSVARDVVVLG